MPTLHAFRLPLVASSLAVAIVAGACTPAAAPTASPSSPPASTPGATGSPNTASPQPTGTPASTGTAAPTATAAPTPTPEGHIDHPTGATDIVLRTTVAGGFVPSDIASTQVPQFTLYGDGTVVYFDNTQQLPFPGPGEVAKLPPLRLAKMSEEQMSALLRFALGQAGLLDARPGLYPNPLIADAPNTYIDIDAGGVIKSFEIQGLMETEESMADVPEPAQRRRFSQLTRITLDFATYVRRGDATDAGIYKPSAYRGVLLEQMDAPDAKPWPFKDLKPADFVVGPDHGAPKGVMTPAQVDVVAKEAYGGVVGMVYTGPDRKHYRLSIRPLLPDEEA